MLTISLLGRTLCHVPTNGLTFDQLCGIRQIWASKMELKSIYELDISAYKGET